MFVWAGKMEFVAGWVFALQECVTSRNDEWHCWLGIAIAHMGKAGKCWAVEEEFQEEKQH